MLVPVLQFVDSKLYNAYCKLRENIQYQSNLQYFCNQNCTHPFE